MVRPDTRLDIDYESKTTKTGDRHNSIESSKLTVFLKVHGCLHGQVDVKTVEGLDEVIREYMKNVKILWSFGHKVKLD